MKTVRVRPYLRRFVRRRFVLAPAEQLTEYHPESQFRVMMSPAQFLSAVGPWSREHVSEEGVQKLMERMEADQEIDPLFLDVDPRPTTQPVVVAHEGRHRAVAAERLGIIEVPVIVYLYRRGEGYVEATPDRIRRARRAIGLG